MSGKVFILYILLFVLFTIGVWLDITGNLPRWFYE